MIRTRNFILISPNEEIDPEEEKTAMIDTRNNILCYSPSCDWDCWVNYIELLNSLRDKWVNTSYLDMGMVPVFMAPTFMSDYLTKSVHAVFSALGIKPIPTKPLPLLQEKTKAQTLDFWAFKEDVAKVMGVAEKDLTMTKFIRWCENHALNGQA